MQAAMAEPISPRPDDLEGSDTDRESGSDINIDELDDDASFGSPSVPSGAVLDEALGGLKLDDEEDANSEELEEDGYGVREKIRPS